MSRKEEITDEKLNIHFKYIHIYIHDNGREESDVQTRSDIPKLLKIFKLTPPYFYQRNLFLTVIFGTRALTTPCRREFAERFRTPAKIAR